MSGFIRSHRFRDVTQLIAVRKFFGAVKTKAALTATIGTNRDEKQDPEFQNPSALGAMHVHASAPGTGLFRVVNEESEDTPHRKSIILRSVSGRNAR
jgi:hypothetical protein